MSVDIDGNKRVSVALLEAICALDVPAALALMTDDITWWSCGTTVSSGTRDRAQFIALSSGMFDVLAAPIGFEPRLVISDGDHVVIECRLTMPLKSGASYANEYVILFHLRDGLVASVREYMDTEYFSSVFPRPT